MRRLPKINALISAALAVSAGTSAAFLIQAQSQGLLFLVFALCMLPPGLLAARLLWRDSGFGRQLLAGFYLGFAVLILQYFVLNAAGALGALRWSVPAIGILSLAALVFFTRGKSGLDRKPLSSLAELVARHHLLLWVIAVGVWYSYYITNIRFSTPDTVYSADMQWHMGNIYTLGAPGFQDIRILGMTFRYHYFSDLLFAAGRLVFGFSPYYCVLRFPALITPVLMGLSVYLLVGLSMQNRIARAAATAAVLYLFPLFGRYNDLTYQWLTNVNAVGLAVPCLVLVLLIARHVGAHKISWVKTVVLLAIATAVLSGLKGPFAVCVAAGALGALLYTLLKQEQGTQWTAVFGGIVPGFLPVWFLLLRGGMNDAYLFTDRLLMAVSHADVLSRPIIMLGDNFWARLVFLPVQFIFVTGIFAVPFLSALTRAFVSVFRRRNAVEPFVFFCSFGAFLSFGAYYYYDMIGRSQNYFLLGASILMVYPALEELRRWRSALRSKPRSVSLPVSVAGTAAVAFCLIFSGFHPMLEDHIQFYSSGEMRAIQWIVSNTSEHDLIAVNRHEAFYLVSGFTGRQLYFEGTRYAKNSGVTEEMLAEMADLNDSLFRADLPAEQRQASMRELGITCLIQWTNPYADAELTAPLGEGFEICYFSDDVLIWRIAE